MFMSQEVNEISKALSGFQSELKQPKLNKDVKVTTKSGKNYSFKYADLSACVEAAAPTLKKYELAVTQILTGGKLVTLLVHSSGQWFRSDVSIVLGDAIDYQDLGSAITYLKRYSYCAILGIVADTDDDANAACGNQAQFNDTKKTTNTSRAKKSTGTAAIAYTGEQLKQAIAEVEAATSNEEYGQVWNKWSEECPALCVKGTEFYDACIKKANELQS